MNDKFDYFVCMMLKDDKIPLSDELRSEDRPAKDAKYKEVSTTFIKQNEKKELLAQFKEFSTMARSADLGGRQEIRNADDNPGGSKRIDKNWLKSLEKLKDVEEESELRASQY